MVVEVRAILVSSLVVEAFLGAVVPAYLVRLVAYQVEEGQVGVACLEVPDNLERVTQILRKMTNVVSNFIAIQTMQSWPQTLELN
jgi:hypothetical protein